MKEIQKDRGSVFGDKDSWEILNQNIKEIKPSSIFILVDSNTQKYCLPYFLKKISFIKEPVILKIPAGEKTKNSSTCVTLWEELTNFNADRNSLLINLGGGMVSDLGGFVASTFKRGIEFIHIPTTLLAMIDAAVGGKNGINLGVLKNQVGVIRNPKLTLIDVAFLKTLAPNEVNSGYAEMLKHGLIYSENYWNKSIVLDINNHQNMGNLIWESIQIKSSIVESDPFEKGLRKTLNFGHTLGHAIESYCLKESSKKALLHGEAVAIGMILVCYLSTKILSFSEKKCFEITKKINSKFKKIDFTNNDIQKIIELLAFDKKNRNGKVLFVLLNDFGNCEIDCQVPNELILEAFEYYKNIES